MIGLNAPDFTLPATGGWDVSLFSLRGQKVVLYFYPKDNTPGCTTETQDFATLYDKFEAAGCSVFGISRDSVKSHEKFKEKLNVPFDLLSDAEGKLCEAFGVLKEKNMYGKKVFGIERSTFLLDAMGIVIQEWRGVKVPGHAEEVLRYVQSMSSSRNRMTRGV